LKSPNATYYLRGRGYRNEDFEKIVSAVAGTDMSDFFRRYVRGVETPPYSEAFRQVGLRFVSQPLQPVFIGISSDENEATNFKLAEVKPDSPASKAGLQVGDVIVLFDGTRLTQANFYKTIGRFKPGDKVALSVLRARKTIQLTLTMGEPTSMSFRIEDDKSAPAEAKTLRAAWLSGK